MLEIEPTFGAKVLQDLLERREARQEHLTFLILKLSSGTFRPSGGTAMSQIKLSDLLKRNVTSEKALEKLFKLGLTVKDGNIELAVDILSESNASTFELILSKQKGTSLDLPCQKAMKAKKFKFIASLIKYGAKPPRDELKSLIGWPKKDVDPIFKQYLASRDSFNPFDPFKLLGASAPFPQLPGFPGPPSLDSPHTPPGSPPGNPHTLPGSPPGIPHTPPGSPPGIPHTPPGSPPGMPPGGPHTPPGKPPGSPQTPPGMPPGSPHGPISMPPGMPLGTPDMPLSDLPDPQVCCTDP